MTATEELRALLDERGVEWNGDSYGFCEEVTSFDVDRLDCAFSEFDKWSTMFRVWNITPAQVVEATLGRGECKKLPSDGTTKCIVRRHGCEREFGYWKCSACGCECFDGARYCMNCGAKVVGG